MYAVCKNYIKINIFIYINTHNIYVKYINIYEYLITILIVFVGIFIIIIIIINLFTWKTM